MDETATAAPPRAAPTVAVLVAVTGHLVARGRLVLAAGAPALVAVVLAVASALVVVLHTPREAPALSLQLTGAPDARVLAAQFSVPGLAAGSVVDVKLVGQSDQNALDDGTAGPLVRVLAARSIVPAGANGVAVAQLTAPVDGFRTVVVTAAMPGRTCRQALALDDVDAPGTPLACTAA